MISPKFSFAATLSASLLASLIAAPSFAAAPMVKTSAPGFFRMMVGDIEVTALSDGTIDLPADKLLTNTTPAKVKVAMDAAFLPIAVETSVNAYLVNTGSKLVMIDAGTAGLFGPTLGKLIKNLKAAGYQPEQVDEIYITHMHADHVGGLMEGEQRAFPNAVVRADKHDADHWLSAAKLEQAKGDDKHGFQQAQVSLNAYVKADKFKPFEGSVELVPGVKSWATKGHTPGHSNYVVESKGQKLMLIGDMIHVGAVQFPNPSVTIVFDSDSKQAMAARKALFADAAKGGYMIGAAHIAFPGIGRLRAQGKGFQWVPVNHTELR
jgi:glyoxylase-like metal-dependent hydrolase (beta-lactamase superfamily II)